MTAQTTTWHGNELFKLQYILFFARQVVPKYRPDIQAPMLSGDGTFGASFFAIAESGPSKVYAPSYEKMAERTGIAYNLLCGIDMLCGYLPISLARWYPLDALCSIPVGTQVPENSRIIQFIAAEVNAKPEKLDKYHGERFGLGYALADIAQEIGSPHAVAIALLNLFSTK